MNAAVSGLLFLLLALCALEGPERVARRRAAASEGGAVLRGLAFDAWACGVLAAHLFVVRALARSDQGLAATGREMVLALVPALAGLGIAAFAGMRALGRDTAAEQPSPGGGPGSPAGWAGAGLLVLVVAATLVLASRSAAGPRLAPSALLLHLPALLVFAGTTLLLLRVAGRAGTGPGRALAIALSGALAGTAGLVQTLLGFVEKDLPRVTAGVSFLLTSGFVSVLALVLLAREEAGEGVPQPARTAGLVARALLPLAGLLFLVVALVLVMTPMTAPG